MPNPCPPGPSPSGTKPAPATRAAPGPAPATGARSAPGERSTTGTTGPVTGPRTTTGPTAKAAPRTAGGTPKAATGPRTSTGPKPPARPVASPARPVAEQPAAKLRPGAGARAAAGARRATLARARTRAAAGPAAGAVAESAADPGPEPTAGTGSGLGTVYERMLRANGIDALRAARGAERALFPFSDELGMRVTAVGPGEVLLSVRPLGTHQGWPENTHGGFLATLCDTACGLAVVSLAPARHTVVTASLSVQYLRPVPAPGGAVGCLGTVTHRQGSRVLARADVTGGDGEVLATATAVMLIRTADPDGDGAADGAADGGEGTAASPARVS
ncbi:MULTISPECIES: PaaI family thioesterase [Kitasatospora]|uniref:Acyl-coenzyme A thioesterase THEM4 n=1 Tax=Kitasatospora setae (strain ATCC 33774 / DSM 43861 / JCM 3304 / KCC A-0304 / NBRC 14216 / KM-6054) TaxID=452652 RepID=E4N0T4_KITSK|nr:MULTISPECIES: PaaI family thioesterase [Kitasatospora]BAJ31768.1 hypothetical protein KSE_59980 [Kitasatospora setae KM-6054]